MGKKIIARIASITLTVAVIAGFFIGDYICYQHENEITSWLSPSKFIYDKSNVTEVLNSSKIVAEQIAAEGITMLKNNGALPLNTSKETEQRINLFGVGATDLDTNGFYVFGAGSGSITAAKKSVVFPIQGLEQAGFSVNQNLYDFFKERKSNPPQTWWGSSQSTGTLNYAKAWSDTAVIIVSRLSGENVEDESQAGDMCSNSYRYPWDVSYVDSEADGRNFAQFSLKEEAMINWCADNFEKTVVIINSGNVMELGLLDNDKVDAVLYCPYTGQWGANELGNILAGITNPSGRTTDTFMYDSKTNPTWANAFIASSSTLGRQIVYAEDIYVGYKWYETANYEGYFQKQGKKYEEVVWRPFGYGLSYTTFEWELESIAKKVDGETLTMIRSGDTIDNKGTTVQVSVTVKNTGKVAGKEVVQLYANAPYTKGGIEKAYLTLAAFAKTDTLYPASQADENHPNSQTVTLEFDLYGLASYDCYDKNGNSFAGWELEGGTYTMSLRNNVHTLNECENAEFTFKVPSSGFKWQTDPDSDGDVHNRFTGATAEAGVPIDGSAEGNEPVTYLSRADFEGTFPSVKAVHRAKGFDLTKDGTYVTDDYYPEAQMPTLNSTETQHLLYTLEDGSKATLDQLYQRSSLVPNDELIMKLGADYNAPEWEELLNQLSFIELTEIVCRSGNSRHVESIGKPYLVGVDGPQGVNSYTFTAEPVEDVTGFPAEALVGMTFNVDLARQEGAAMGVEASGRGYGSMFAPAVDLHRHIFNGRNYEQYGEDPLVCGVMGSKVAYGLITQGIPCSIKHFVCSQPGMNPRDYNTWLTEQNLRENYLKPFEICVKDAEANFIMTSFNNIGGVRCAYSWQLNNGVLREEWGFKGSVITDYDVNSPSRTTASLIRSGNDLRFQGSVANRVEISEGNVVDVYLARRSAKNALYSYCNSYYRAKTYDPNYTVSDVIVIPGNAWWVPTLIVVEVLALGGLAYFIVRSFLPKKKRSKAPKNA